MRDNRNMLKFRVWCKRTRTMQGTYGWFLLQQDGALFSHGLMRPATEEPLEHYEIMQYIGVRDKRGAEICEGDIVRYEGHVTDIYYHDARFMPREIEGKCGVFEDYTGTKYSWNELEVIGNVYENPELGLYVNKFLGRRTSS